MTEPPEADRTSTAAAEPSPDDLFAAALSEMEPASVPTPPAPPSAEPEPAGPGTTPPAVAADELARDVPDPGPATSSVADAAVVSAPSASPPVEPVPPLPDLSDLPPDGAAAVHAESVAPADAPPVQAANGALVPAELIAVVRAWQHRHPWARRLRPEEVGYIGLVALPYFSPGDVTSARHAGAAEPDLGDRGLPAHVAEVIPTLADAPAPFRPSPADVPSATPPATPAMPGPVRAGWRERVLRVWTRWRDRLPLPGGHRGTVAAGGWVPGFDDEPLIDGVTTADLARFASRHAFDEPPGEADWPTRALACQPGRDIHAAHWRFLMTVALRVPGGEPVRVLIGRSRSNRRGHSVTPILGVRPLDRRRQAVAVLLGTVLLTGLGTGVQRWRAGGQATDAVAGTVPAAAASGAASASDVAASAPAGAHLAEPAASATMPAREASSPEQTGEGPVAASVVPSASALLRPAAPPPAVRPAPDAEPPRPTQPQAARTTGRPSPEPVRHALVSRPQGQPAAAQALAQRLRQALGPEGAALRVEVMNTAGGPVVTLWPVADEREAERLALAFTRAGVPMRVQSF